MSPGQLLNKYLLSISGFQLMRSAEIAALRQKASNALSRDRANQKAFRKAEQAFNRDIAKRLSRLEGDLNRVGNSVNRLMNEVDGDQENFLELARLFSPRTAVGHDKTRLGREYDGGYVMLDDFEGIEAAFSFGVADDSSWDMEIAERGIQTYQFDHTIDCGPATHPNLSFFPRKIVSAPDEDGETIEALLDRYGGGADASLILKMDIEGDEWPILDRVEPKHLRKFAQIVCEFHRFNQSKNQDWYQRAKRVMEKLAADFEVVHVHGNNANPFVLIGNVPFPNIIEVTFANRARYEFVECEETFPTPLDQPNLDSRADLFLGRFMF